MENRNYTIEYRCAMITEIDYSETSEQPQEEKSYEDIGYWIPEDWGTERIKICIGALLEKGAFGRRAGGDRTAASCTPLETAERCGNRLYPQQ